MASTYSTNLAIELIGTGDQAGTWGNTTNTNLGTLIEQAISGYVTQAVATGTDTTITIPNGATGVARNMFIELTGTGGTNTNLIVPANKKLYFIYNNTASGQVTVKVSGQTGVSVPNGSKLILVSNGTDIVEATTSLNAIPSSISVTTLTATSADITTLTGTSANITTVTGTTGGFTSANITTLSGTSANITTINGTSANITTVTGTTGGFTSANITTVSSTSANITTLTGTSATITTILDGAGNIRDIPSVGAAKTTEYTLSVSDIGEYVTVGASGAITIPNDVFATGNAVSIYNDTSGNITITCSITTAYLAGTDTDQASLTLATRGIATVLFTSPSACVLTGNLS